MHYRLIRKLKELVGYCNLYQFVFRNARRDLIFLRKQTWNVMGKMVGLRNKKCEMPNKPQNHLAYQLSGRHGKELL